MIEVEHLTKSYRTLRAVDDLSFAIDKGEIVGFLGPNGAGKTTTMRVLTGFIPATSGHARVAGFDLFESPLEVKRRIGYLPETPPIYPEMTARGYLAHFARLKGVPRRRIAAEVDRVAERTATTRVLDRVLANLSKGFRQRVGLAQALLGDPEVLILDEPTEGLDPGQIIEVRDLVKGLAGDHTVILSTHILPEVTHTCERVIIINQGRLVAEDRIDNLVGMEAGRQQVGLLVARDGPQVAVALKGIPGVCGVLDQGEGRYQVQTEGEGDPRAELARAMVEGGFGLLELASVSTTLEEVFLKLTTAEELGGLPSPHPAPAGDGAAELPAAKEA